eukprot:TRINITY_DN48424_c0_g1_i1.p1 TRINITY_DN48424_c0_g1~~TRINITY_DN48424_c0_g1_i1.p1  ORF type:complete len:784 (-),score=62.52 TRINITY_DN48424_c0_g1_i1:114-2465(-)
MLLLHAVVTHYVAAGFAQTNHLYKDGARVISGVDRPGHCATFEADNPDVVLNSEKYPWSPGVRRGGGSDVLYGTAYAQRVIWEHQHPHDCHEVKYLTMLHWPVGIGAMLHYLAHALGLAMHLGRILVLSIEGPEVNGRTSMPWYDASFCPGATSWECWFQPITDCPERVGADTMVIPMEQLDLFRGPGNFTRHYVPEVFHEMLRECSHVKPSVFFHWWHVQAVTYIVRFNWQTRNLLNDLRGRLLYNRRADFQRPRHWVPEAEPLPAGTLAMHVRHGDKGIEMPILPIRRYLYRAQQLAAGDQAQRVVGSEFSGGNRSFRFPHTKFAARSLFISTEDPEVMRQAWRLAEGGYQFLHRGRCHGPRNRSMRYVLRRSADGDGDSEQVTSVNACAERCKGTQRCAFFSVSFIARQCTVYGSMGSCAVARVSGSASDSDYRSYRLNSRDVPRTRFTYVCAAEEERECTCHGTVYYGGRSPPQGITLEEMQAADYRQELTWGVVPCSSSFFGTLASDVPKYCLCEPAEELSYVYIYDSPCQSGSLIGLDTKQPSIGACAARCRATMGCGYFSFQQTSLDCLLHDSGKECSQNGSRVGIPFFRMVHEVDYVLIRSDGRCANDGLLWGYDTKQLSLDDCATQCRNHVECAYFSYHQFSGACALFLEGSRCNHDLESSGFRSYHMLSNEPWQVFFTRENRTNADVAAMRRERGTGHATLQSFLNLELALEAEGWVCTLFSNWCQLIDELRMTVGAKASAPFVNLVHGAWRSSRRRSFGCPFQQPDCCTHWR